MITFLLSPLFRWALVAVMVMGLLTVVKIYKDENARLKLEVAGVQADKEAMQKVIDIEREARAKAEKFYTAPPKDILEWWRKQPQSTPDVGDTLKKRQYWM
jgi:hypothetical protein